MEYKEFPYTIQDGLRVDVKIAKKQIGEYSNDFWITFEGCNNLDHAYANVLFLANGKVYGIGAKKYYTDLAIIAREFESSHHKPRASRKSTKVIKKSNKVKPFIKRIK